MAEPTNRPIPPENESKNRRRLIGFFLFPIALFPLLALISYRWQAIEKLNLPPEASSNLIGVVGDAFAYNGYQLIGLALWAVPPLTLFLGLLLVREVETALQLLAPVQPRGAAVELQQAALGVGMDVD